MNNKKPSDRETVRSLVLELDRFLRRVDVEEELKARGLTVKNVGAHLSDLATRKLLDKCKSGQPGQKLYGPPGAKKVPAKITTGAPVDVATAATPVMLPAALEPAPMNITTSEKKTGRKRPWLVQPFLPMGEVALLTGDKRTGKGLWCAHVAAAASKGERAKWDLCEDRLPPHHVVWVTPSASEDSSDEMKTRFEVAGGNLDRFTHLPFDGDRKQLQAQIAKIEGPKLIILDPIQVAVEDLTGRNVRREMEELVKLARDTGSTVIAIRHVLKSGQGGRGRGEVADVVRSEVVLGPHPDDQDLVVIAHAPSSYGQGDPVAFRRKHAPDREDDVPSLELVTDEWDDDIKWEDLLPSPARRRKKRPRTRRDIIGDWLLSLLKAGPKSRPEIISLGKRRHYAERTIERAATDLSVIRSEGSVGEAAVWSLPSAPVAAPSASPCPAASPAPVVAVTGPVSAPEWQTGTPLQPSAHVGVATGPSSATAAAKNGMSRGSSLDDLKRLLLSEL